jgi:arylsulfatase A-like enzyme
MAAGPGIRRQAELAPFSIVDITPTLLHALGLPLPSDLDGGVTTAAFEASWAEAHPVGYEEGGAAAALPTELGPAPGLGTEGEQEVLRRLKALGYLD